VHKKRSDSKSAQVKQTGLSMGLQSVRRKNQAVGLFLVKANRLPQTDLNQPEYQAIDDAMYFSGVYLDAVGKTELMSFTYQEYRDLIEVIVIAFRDSLRDSFAEDPPF
jgi:hypothetical protein